MQTDHSSQAMRPEIMGQIFIFLLLFIQKKLFQVSVVVRGYGKVN